MKRRFVAPATKTVPTAYLTVDDAPSPELPAKLEILESAEVPALFFCEGRRLADYPEQARRAIEGGYHLGNHGYSHQHASECSPETFRSELERTDALIDEVYEQAGVDRPAKLFRFPYGDKGDENAEEFQRILESAGFVPPDPERIDYEWYRDCHTGDRDWFWTDDLEDWSLESRAELRERIESAANRLASPSPDIVLFHDAGTASDLFAELVGLLEERGVEFGAPLSLLP
ncbi:polysaccharide deacetylase family protein [Natrialba sp. INN-245]|uniref:polysaccharide deacetylase family protein n=1 Tax=Natrialba sp. INN-245 TaxID=2690967 RepID=UPI001311A41E|nr:polysaccharide deacetylase family protein [Natrialba sp. INN-245]MWV40657.1 polysaccharide deacetylase family protein [Natrialba sp. INN-245]